MAKVTRLFPDENDRVSHRRGCALVVVAVVAPWAVIIAVVCYVFFR